MFYFNLFFFIRARKQQRQKRVRDDSIFEMLRVTDHTHSDTQTQMRQLAVLYSFFVFLIGDCVLGTWDAHTPNTIRRKFIYKFKNMDATATKMPMTRLSNILIRLDIVLQRYYAEYNLMQLALSLTLSLSLPSDIDTESQTQQRDL